MNEPRPYSEWRSEPTLRWRDAFHSFGHLLFANAKTHALAHLPSRATDAERRIADDAVTNALYGLMMIIEGVDGLPVSAGHRVEFALTARVRRIEPASEIVEQYELGPDGEESACMGFHLWAAGEFQE
jgi:hypothetical protein